MFHYLFHISFFHFVTNYVAAAGAICYLACFALEGDATEVYIVGALSRAPETATRFGR